MVQFYGLEAYNEAKPPRPKPLKQAGLKANAKD